MACDLMPGTSNIAHRLAVRLSDAARNEERGADVAALEEVEDQRDADVDLVVALTDDEWLAVIVSVHGRPHGLGIDVDGEAEGTLFALWPGNRGHHLHVFRTATRSAPEASGTSAHAPWPR